MKKLLVLFFVILSSGMLYSQTPIDWSDFESGISWKEGTEGSTFPGFLEANFSDKLENLDGKKISIIGFLIVLDGAQSVYMLSKNPMADCFFCGNGGPETISQLTFTEPTSYKMDDLISVTGVLRLNGKDPTRCYYLIEDAEAFGM